MVVEVDMMLEPRSKRKSEYGSAYIRMHWSSTSLAEEVQILQRRLIKMKRRILPRNHQQQLWTILCADLEEARGPTRAS